MTWLFERLTTFVKIDSIVMEILDCHWGYAIKLKEVINNVKFYSERMIHYNN